MEDKDPWSEATQTYANLLPSARYLTKSVLDQREDADNQRWLRSSLISIPTAAPEPAAGDPDSDLDDGESDGGDSVAGRVIARYRPDSAGRLRIEFGFLPEWAFTSTANTEAAVERFGEQLLPRSRYLTASLISNRRDSWLRSSLVQIPAAIEPNGLTINITSPVHQFEQREEVEARRIGTIEGPLSDQLDPITISGTPPGLTLHVTDAGDELKRLILSGTVAADADERSYTVRITARPADGDPVSESFTIRIDTGKEPQTLTWNRYSPDTEQVGGRVTFRAPRVVKGPSRPEWSYSSDTPRICTVDSRTGALTLVAAGQCQVSATSAAREGFREGEVQTIVIVGVKPPPDIRWQGYDSREAVVGEPPPGVRRPTATVDGRSVRLDYAFEVDEDSERDGICDVNTRSGQINALAAGTCIVIAKSAETDDYAAAESDPVRVTITKEKLPPDLRWDGYEADDTENLRAGDAAIAPIEPEPRLREARGNLTYTYETTTRSVCSVDSRTGELAPRGRGSCEVTVMSEETDDFLADEVMVDISVLGERGRPDLDWFDYRDSLTARGGAIDPTRPGSRDRVGPLSYRSETPNVCSVDSRSGRLSGREEGTCRVTVTSEESDELYEGSETISVRIGGKPEQRCDLSYPGDVSAGDQISPRLVCEDNSADVSYRTDDDTCSVNRNSGDVTGRSRGRCRIEVTISETARFGETDARATIQVTEDRPPECRRGAIGDVGPLNPGESSRSISLSDSSPCSDPEGQRLSYDAESDDTDIATVRISGGSLTVTAARDGDGTTTITVTAADPGRQTDTTRFRVTVEGNSPPIVSSIPSVTLDAGDDETVNLWSYFSDPDNDDLTYTVRSSNTSVATISERREVLTIRAGTAGTATITVTADDGNGGTVSGTISVTVREEAPVINSIRCSPSRPEVDENVTCTASLSGGAPDTYSWSGGSSSGSRSSYSTSFSSSGRQTVSLTVRNTGGSDDGSTSVDVSEEAPAINSISCSPSRPEVDESVTCTASLSGGTPDAYSWSDDVSSGSRSTYTTSFSASGSKSVSLTVSNSGGNDTKAIFFSVTPETAVNRAPICDSIPDQFITPLGRINLDLGLYCTDPDGDVLTIKVQSSDTRVWRNWNWSTQPTAGLTRLRERPPSGGSIGIATQTVTATDPSGLFATASFKVKVGNFAPIPTCDSFHRTYVLWTDNSSGTVDSSSCFSDPEGATLWYRINRQSGLNSLRTRINGSQITVTSPTGHTGDVVFEITAFDMDDGYWGDHQIPGGASTAIPWRVTVLPWRAKYATCDDKPASVSRGSKIYYFNTSSWTKHHLDLSVAEFIDIVGSSRFHRDTDQMSSSQCDDWNTGDTYNASEVRNLVRNSN